MLLCNSPVTTYLPLLSNATFRLVISVRILTVTFWVAVAEFPAKSVAFQVTFVFPTGKPPDGASFVTAIFATGVRLSLTVGVPKSTAVSVPVEAFCVSAGAVIVGFVLSMLISITDAEASLPALSLTVPVEAD